MSRPRRRMFGPLFYTTVVVAILLTALTEVYTGFPMVTEWLRERSLIRSLRADDSGEREAAATTLVKLGSGSAVPQLIAAARDPRADLRAMACRYLIRAGAELDVVVPILVAAANDVEENVRYEAACAFGCLISPGVPGRAQLIVTSHGELSPSLRSASIKALRRLVYDQASPTRILAADALGLFGPDPEAAADLAAVTGDNDRDVRFAAARALLKVGGPNDPVAGRTLVALVADPEAIADRRAILDVVLSAGEDVRGQAVAALARLVAGVDLPHDKDDIHGDVVDCLVSCGPRARAALPTIERLLNAEDPVERATAGIAAATIEGNASPRSISILLNMIDDLAIAPESRQAALEKIREFNEAELVKATPILIRQLGSKSADVRLTAMGMLASIIENTPALMPAATSAK
jgi:HEAT repeat protein